MKRFAGVAVRAALVCPTFAGQSLEFEVASIKKNTTNQLGLPSWAESERHDVVAQGRAGGTPEAQQQMWRALLADRMTLAAHDEPREQPSWDLVFARSDHRLGPQIQPSTPDCSEPEGECPSRGLSSTRPSHGTRQKPRSRVRRSRRRRSART